MTDDIKLEFAAYVQETLDLPAPGISSVDDFHDRELRGMHELINFIKTVPGAPPELQQFAHPREMLGSLNSIVIVAIPNYMTAPLGFEQCREGLRGALSAGHMSGALKKRMALVQDRVTAFFTDRGHVCRPLPMNAPMKIFAARSGIGFYGKNSMIITDHSGSWISLTGYAIDARLEPDGPHRGDCAECKLCVKACPAKALDKPYTCSMQDCINFQLQSKNGIPETARPLLKHGLAYGACRVCRDVCPHNRNLAAFVDPELTDDILNPNLLEILDCDDQRWNCDFVPTRTGAIMQNRRYVIRNALIALGNFGDARAAKRIAQELANDDPLLREYAAWALRKIGGPEVQTLLQNARNGEDS
jgi:epoxyqueuosine reductase QueG